MGGRREGENRKEDEETTDCEVMRTCYSRMKYVHQADANGMCIMIGITYTGTGSSSSSNSSGLRLSFSNPFDTIEFGLAQYSYALQICRPLPTKMPMDVLQYCQTSYSNQNECGTLQLFSAYFSELLFRASLAG